MFDIFSSKLEIGIVILIIGLFLFLFYIHRKSTLSTENNQKLGVTELIQQVKKELVEMEEKRVQTKEAPLFVVKEFELEVNFVVKENYNQKGDFDFKVVTVGNETDLGTEKTQKITLRMTTILPEQQTSQATDEPTTEFPEKKGKK
jgi:hypothetical protein